MKKEYERMVLLLVAMVLFLGNNVYGQSWWGSTLGSMYTNKDNVVIDNNGNSTEAALLFGANGGRIGFNVAENKFVFNHKMKVMGGITLTGGISSNDNIVTIGGIDAKKVQTNAGSYSDLSALLLIANDDGIGVNQDIIFGFGGDASSYTESMRLTDEGNLGIGTASPSERLVVTGGNALFRGNARIEDGELSIVQEGANTVSINSNASGAMVFSSVNSFEFNENFSFTKENMELNLAKNFAINLAGLVSAFCVNSPEGASIFYTGSNGRIGIGTSSPSESLHVNGTVRAASFVSDASKFPDYVFDKTYDLATIRELESYVYKHKHLPGVPSENEVIANGLDLKELGVLTLEKVEELFLYIIDLQDQIDGLEAQIIEEKTQFRK